MAIANLANIDRAAHEIRCGRAVEVDGVGFIHPEYITAENYKNINHGRLVITKTRAHAIFGTEFSDAQQVELKHLSFDQFQTFITGKKITGITTLPVTDKTANAALELSRIAQLLPTAILVDATPDLLKISAAEILSYKNNATESLQLVATAPLKLCDAPEAEIKAFRSSNGALEHMAIIIGKLGEEPVIRIHSSCYTGDLLGSLACDCGDQLRGAIKLIHESGGGVILYLMQEGRGIGLVNKLHAYQLQSEGLDTVEANEFLGFDDEERSFEAAAVILKKLGVSKAKLITNNPKKMRELEQLGIKVTERLPMVIVHEHNHAYLQVKSSKSGHII